MIPSFATAGVLTAPSAALILSGYVPGNPLAAQHYNWMWGHLTLELNNLLTLGGVVQDAAVDTQIGTAVQNVTQKALAIMNCVRVTTGSALTVPIGSGTIITALGSGSTYTVTLPSAASALAAGFEVDIQNHNAGATNMLGSGYGSVLVKLLNVNDALAGFTNGTWQITEQYGHLRVRPSVSGAPSGYGWVVESCEGSIYRTVLTADQTASGTGAWVNFSGGASLALPAGVYEGLGYQCALFVSVNSAVSLTLSIANNSESDKDLTCEQYLGATTSLIANVFKQKKRIVVLSASTYYLNGNLGSGTITIRATAPGGNAIIEAKRVG
jgi:hypothetical protein